jgi:hypothetical protein
LKRKNLSNNLLLNILPEETQELKKNGKVLAKKHELAVLFTDFEVLQIILKIYLKKLVESIDYYFQNLMK